MIVENGYRHWAAIYALIATCAASLAPGASTAEELKLAHFMSPKHVMHRAILEPLSEDIDAATGGKLTIRIYPAGELGKGPVQQYQRAVEGVADITFGLQGYTSNLFPRTMLIELPGIVATPEEATAKMWDAFGAYLEEEYRGTKVLGVWTNDMAVIMTRDKPVDSLDDLEGLRIRTPSKAQARILEALGATPVQLAVPKIYTSLQTGHIDGVMIGPCAIPAFKLGEVAKYYTVGAPLAVTSFYTVMDEDAWDGLSPEDQTTITKLTGRDWSLKAAEAYAGCGEKGLEMAAAGEGNMVIELDDAERARWLEAVAPVVDETVDELETAGHPAGDILDAMGVAH